MRARRQLWLAAAAAAFLGSYCSATAGVVEASIDGGFISGNTSGSALSFFLAYAADPGSSPVSGEISGTVAFGDGASTSFMSDFNPNASYSQAFPHTYANPNLGVAFLTPSVEGIVDVFAADGSTIDSVDYSATGFAIIVPGLPDPLPITPAPIASGVPESSTWAMMLLGFGGLGFLAYRKARERCASGALVAA